MNSPTASNDDQHRLQLQRMVSFHSITTTTTTTTTS